MIGPAFRVLGEHKFIVDRPSEVMVKQTGVISCGRIHENPPAGVMFVTWNKFGNSKVGHLFCVLCVKVSKDAYSKWLAEFSVVFFRYPFHERVHLNSNLATVWTLL